jgi:Skp family chaperone for outer membrane proteins
LGKGSTRRPLLISEQEAEDNWNKIFGQKKHYELDDGQLTDEQYAKIKDYEYELNKSTGEVEKRFLDGVSKPNESQFDGDKPNAVKP